MDPGGGRTGAVTGSHPAPPTRRQATAGRSSGRKGTLNVNLMKWVGAAGAVLVGLTLLACGFDGGVSTGTNDKGAQGASAPADDKPAGPVVAQLGGKGLIFEKERIEVAVSKTGNYRPSKYAEPVAKGEVAFTLNVKVTNTGTEAIKPSGLYFTASVGANAAEAEQIFDTDAGLNGTPETALLPGKSATFKLGFKAPTTEANPEINVNVSPITTGTTGLFQGHLKG